MTPRNHENSPENLWPSRVVIDESLAISRITAADAPEFYAAVDANRERLGRYLEWAEHYDAEKAAHDCHTMEEETNAGNAAAYKIEYDGEFAGSVTLTGRAREEAEFTIWLTQESRGKYIATRSAQTLLELGFSNWGLSAVVMHCEADNDAARNLNRRIGAHKIMTATPASGGFETWEITPEDLRDE